jgi:hypothetical protein
VIEPSREVVQAAWDESDFVYHTWESVEAAVTKAIEVLEQKYALVDRQAVDRPRCGYVHEVRCEFPEGHPGRHGRVRIEEFS